MAKNPCLHPGDIRILEAVDVPCLRHLVDCLVFPQKGDMPHSNEASGSDLDGDNYFVTWDENLIPPSKRSATPMDYDPGEPKTLPCQVVPQGPIVTNIRALLTPHPMKELRVKGSYVRHRELKAAQGIKISAQGLEHAIAGTALYAVGPNDDLEDIKKDAMHNMDRVMSRIEKSAEGVSVQASTLGSLEALIEFLRSPAVNIPLSDFSIGPVHKKDVMKASVMLEKRKEYATILAFDVKVMPDARELAAANGVKIFAADIIYHLSDQFKAYIDELREEMNKEAVFPCVLKIIPECIISKKDPIVLGVQVLQGILKVGTPVCIPSKDCIDIGRIVSIRINHIPAEVATSGEKVSIKIVGSNPEERQLMFGRDFGVDDELVSRISRRSIDLMKVHYKDDLKQLAGLVVRLKKIFKIP